MRRPRLPTFETVGSRRLLGLFSIFLVFAVVVVATIRPNPFKQTHTVLAVFDSAQGLGRIDQNIRVGGVNVGQIGEVKRVGDDVLMELKLDPDVGIHEDARAELRPHTLFEGTDFVDLFPGSPGAPLLEERGLIPKQRTQVYISVDQALRVLRKPVREALKDLADVGAKTLRGGAIEGLQRTLKGAPELTRDLGPTTRALQGPKGDELSGAIRGMSKTVDALEDREAALVPLARNANRTLAALSVDGGAPLDASLRALPGALGELERSGPQLRALLDRLDTAAVVYRPALRELAPTLADLRPILRRATPVVKRSKPLVRALRVVLARAARATPPFLRLMSLLRRSGRILDKFVLPALSKGSRLGIPTYLQLISAFTGGAGALRPYQSLAQNPNGAGHLFRLAAYADSELLTSTTTPSCATIAILNPQLAAQLGAIGLCQP